MTEVPGRVRAAYRELPCAWKLVKLKFFAAVRNSNVDKTISEDEMPIRLCNYTDVYYNDRITADLHFMEGSATAAEIERFQLRRGQVIVTKDSEAWDDIGIPALITEDMRRFSVVTTLRYSSPAQSWMEASSLGSVGLSHSTTNSSLPRTASPASGSASIR